MRQRLETLEVRTPGRGLVDLTSRIQAVVRSSGVNAGLCTLFCAHTSASLLVQENADPAVQDDLLAWLARLAPDGDPAHAHTAEGPDDMPAHLRAAITRSSETIPVCGGRLALGTWQAIYLAEHRLEAHARRVLVHVLGE